MGIIKRHAAEFRAQFDEAMRESELAELKKDVEKIGHETEASMRAATDTVEKQLADARNSVDAAIDEPAKASNAEEVPPQVAAEATGPGELNGAAGHSGADSQPSTAAESKEMASSAGETGAKTGA
jgi:sec-independent protein translocase protein TatB